MRRSKISGAGSSADNCCCERPKRDSSEDGGKKRDRSLDVAGNRNALTLGQRGDYDEAQEHPPRREALNLPDELEELEASGRPQENHPEANLPIHIPENG